MKKVVAVIFAVVLAITGSVQAVLAENSFKIGLYALEMEQVQTFMQDYPGITFKSAVPPNTTDRLINAFLTDSFDYDVFPLTTSICDMDTVIAKGYLADLTECTGVREAVSSMHPDVCAQVMKDGRIYGVPSSLDFEFLSYNPDAFTRAGFSETDVPDTFTAFLDLLDLWIAYVEETGDWEVCVYGGFDESLYDKSTYTRWLTELLVKNLIMQQSYADEPLRFDTPIFRSCLERCQVIGRRLHELEGAPSDGRLPLVEVNNQSIDNLCYFISLRLDEQQPKLIAAEMRVQVAAVGSNHVDIAAAFALNQLQYEMQNNAMTALLFSNPQLIENPEYAPSVARAQEQLATAQEQLATATNASAKKKAQLEEQVERCKHQLEQVAYPDRAYLISETSLNAYRTFDGHLYFEGPSVFAVGTEYGDMLEQLLDRYATGVISADQFIQRMEEIAWMLQMEEE